MPKQDKEEQWQYLGRMAKLAEQILAHVRQKPWRTVWFFAEVADELEIDMTDVAVACQGLNFTSDAHVRGNSFFLKTSEEKLDDLDWTLGTGRFAQ